MEGTELGRLQGSATLGAWEAAGGSHPAFGVLDIITVSARLGGGRQEPRVLSVCFFFFQLVIKSPASPVQVQVLSTSVTQG